MCVWGGGVFFVRPTCQIASFGPRIPFPSLDDKKSRPLGGVPSSPPRVRWGVGLRYSRHQKSASGRYCWQRVAEGVYTALGDRQSTVSHPELRAFY